MQEGSLFSTPSPAFIVHRFFLMTAVLSSVGWYFAVVLICISLIISYVERLFMCPLVIYMPLWKKCMFWSSAHVVIGWTVWQNFLSLFLSNWRRIALQYCVGFCHISWFSHRYMYVPPSWTSLQPPPPSHPSKLSQSTRTELPASYSNFPPAT